MTTKLINPYLFLFLFILPVIGFSKNLKYTKSDNNTMGHYERLNYIENYLSNVIPEIKLEIVKSINKKIELKYDKKIKSLKKRIKELELLSKSNKGLKNKSKKEKNNEIDIIKKDILNIQNTLVGHSDEIRLVKTQLINEGK